MPKAESSEQKLKPDLPVLVDLNLAHGLNNVLRQHILLMAVLVEVSPKGLSHAFDQKLSHVSYHVRVLRESGLLKKTRTEPRRGATESFYRATSRTLLPARKWRGLKRGMRAVIGAGQASDLFNDLADCLMAGKLQGTHDHITRTPVLLDPQGQRNVKAIAERAKREVEEEQRATAMRRKANGNSGEVSGYTFALLAFETAWKPAGLESLVAGVKGDEAASSNGAGGAGHHGSGEKRDKRKPKVTPAEPGV